MPKEIVLGTIGKCIYCGADRYDSVKRMLAKEHIVPLGLGGDVVLLQTSCRKCEKVTHKPEESILIHSFKAYREQIGYPSRNKRLKKLPLHDVNGTGRTVMISTEDYPQTFAFMVWPLPILLSGQNPGAGHPVDKLWIESEGQTKL